MMILSVFLLLFVGIIFLQRKDYFSLVLGLVLISNGINLAIFFGSRPEVGRFAFDDGAGAQLISNDPLPQALVLTAIVIGFALLGFVVALISRARHKLGPLDQNYKVAEDSHE